MRPQHQPLSCHRPILACLSCSPQMPSLHQLQTALRVKHPSVGGVWRAMGEQHTYLSSHNMSMGRLTAAMLRLSRK